MSRTDQINEYLHRELSDLLNTQSVLSNGLITISKVDCTPDLQYAKIKVSVLPENVSGTALKRLRSLNSFFNSTLRKKTRLRKIPTLRWEFDPAEKETSNIEKLLKETQ